MKKSFCRSQQRAKSICSCYLLRSIFRSLCLIDVQETEIRTARQSAPIFFADAFFASMRVLLLHLRWIRRHAINVVLPQSVVCISNTKWHTPESVSVRTSDAIYWGNYFSSQATNTRTLACVYTGQLFSRSHCHFLFFAFPVYDSISYYFCT